MVLRVNPVLRDQLEPRKVYALPAGAALRAVAFNRVTLAIWGRGYSKDAKVGRGMAQDKLHDLAMGADVQGADEDVGPGLDEPTFEVPPDCGGDVVTD